MTMTKVLGLYNHNHEQVGTASFHKKNATVHIKFNEHIHYGHRTIDINEYDEYKREFDLKDENELGQLELF